MSSDSLRSWLFRSLMFEAESEVFRNAGVRVGADQEDSERRLLLESLTPFSISLRNEALQMGRLYATIYCFENSVRDLITSRLSEKDTDWWNVCIPQRIRTTAESRLKDALDNSWLEGVTQNPLGFVDFGGLGDIVVNNWSEFEDLIPSQHWLKQRFEELERARNFIAHNRMLSQDEFARLEMYVRDWNRQVGL
jgi:Swt1-like HEPN